MTVMKIKIIFGVLVLASSVFAIDYQSKILAQRITHFENSLVDFNVKYYGDEGYPYLILKESITPYNDLHLMLYVRFYDQTPYLLVNAPLSLCQLLHDDTLRKNNTMMQFNLAQIYNFAGKTCPIEQDRLRLSPYRFPSNFSVEIDVGCGYMNVESRLMKCDDGAIADTRTCVTLLKTVTIAFLETESCIADEKNIPSWTGIKETF